MLAVLGVSLIGIVGYSAYGFLEDAGHEMWRDGYFAHGPARGDFNSFLRWVCTGIYVLWSLAVATGSAGGISSEREEDQWTSLTSTPLTGLEIVRAKMIGPAWGLRMVACLMFLLWALGLAVGSIHPLGLMACLVEFVVFTWFLTALGTFISLKSKNSTRSLAITMAVLIFLNGGYLFCCIPFRPDTPAIVAGSTPAVFALSLASVKDFDSISSNRQTGELIAACILGVLVYGFAAAGLTSALISSFDTLIDRPDRFRQGLTPGQRDEYLEGLSSKEIAYPEEVY